MPIWKIASLSSIFVVVFVVSWWGATFAVHSQISTETPFPTVTATPTPEIPDGSKLEFTLVGQLIPAVNTESDAGVGSDFRFGYPFRAYRPIEYHLYDAQNVEIALTFSTALEHQFWLKTVNADTSLIAEATHQSLITPNPGFPVPSYTDSLSYPLYNSLWQEWAGKWVSVKGRFKSNGVLFVEDFHLTPITTTTFAAQVPNLPSLPLPRSLQRSVQLTIRGYVKISEYNPPQRSTGIGYIEPILYTFIDLQGKTFQLFIYDNQPNNFTYIGPRPLQIFSDFAKINKVAEFTGWQFRPPRYPQKPDLLEVQSIQLAVAPPVTEDATAVSTP